jgi:integrase
VARYLVAIKSFCNWLVKDRRMADNPVAHLSRINARSDVRIKRRSATPEELARLIDMAERSERSIRGLTGPERAMLYRVASGTGFRADELASLTPASFDLQADPPTITVAAAYSKRKREDIQPVASHLAELVRPWLASRIESGRDDSADVLPLRRNTGDSGSSGAVWPGTWHERAADMIREDLNVAGIRFETDQGRLDFHSLRHSYISGLAAAGIHPKTEQELARHSDINLTMGVYTHVRLNDLSAALDSLPAPVRPEAQQATGTHGRPDRAADAGHAVLPARPGREPQQATGTTDEAPKMVAGLVADLSGNHCQSLRTIDATTVPESEAADVGLTARMMRDESDCESMKANRAGRTRTCNQRIMSPLL